MRSQFSDNRNTVSIDGPFRSYSHPQQLVARFSWQGEYGYGSIEQAPLELLVQLADAIYRMVGQKPPIDVTIVKDETSKVVEKTLEPKPVTDNEREEIDAIKRRMTGG